MKPHKLGIRNNAVHASSDQPEGEEIQVVTHVQTGTPTSNQMDLAEEWGISYKTIHCKHPRLQPYSTQAAPLPTTTRFARPPPQAGIEAAVIPAPHRQSRARGRRELNNKELSNLVQECFTLFQCFGRNMLTGFMACPELDAAALCINGIPQLFGDRIERWVYAVAGPNALWHHDGQHSEPS
ncbi:hypothetical protein SCHPADRAFT_896384 [Schizopora paradoxa]|uniref:Uncharacterized protein n=1 Tax=Schizopora paradoxa TaxID=27342 RepID=A0A0H2R734_9AGAM|nr:hypothetical protein SCHPADRAFT_896384 [Schizopora paradoxa]